jgi:hypothetical protein
MSSALHRVRLNGKRSHNSTNTLNNNNEESPGGGGGGVIGISMQREKRARLGRPAQSVGNNGPVPMSP